MSDQEEVSDVVVETAEVDSEPDNSESEEVSKETPEDQEGVEAEGEEEVAIEGMQPDDAAKAEDPEEEEPEEIPATAPRWVKKTRERNRELSKEVKELRAKLEAAPKAVPAKEEPLKEPEMSDPDIDFDPAIFKEKTKAWLKSQAEAERKQKEAESAQQEADREWKAKQDKFREASKRFPAKEFEVASNSVSESFTPMQQAIILDAASTPANAASLVMALGRHSAEMKRLAQIKNPMVFAAEIGKLETKIKTTKRVPPPPEKRPTGAHAAINKNNPSLEKRYQDAIKNGIVVHQG